MKLMFQRWHLRGLFQISQVLHNLGGNILNGIIVKMCKISNCGNIMKMSETLQGILIIKPITYEVLTSHDEK